MPSYLGLAHQSSTSFNCSSYKASSAAPAFWLSGSSWKASDGRALETGGLTAGRVNADIRDAAMENGRGWIEVMIRGATPRRELVVAIRRSMLSAKRLGAILLASSQSFCPNASTVYQISSPQSCHVYMSICHIYICTCHLMYDKSESGVASRLASGRFRFLPLNRFSGNVGLPRLDQVPVLQGKLRPFLAS